jgi:hypothetical protein
MAELVKMLLTLGAVLLLFLGCFALLLRFVFAPLMALFAIPTYAAMITLEWLIGIHLSRGCPTPLRFRKPKTFWKKCCMDFCAMNSTILASLLAILIFELTPKGLSPDLGLAKLIDKSSDNGQFFLIAIFWIYYVIVYLISYFHNDPEEHPLNKLEDLVIPDWAKKIAQKFTS